MKFNKEEIEKWNERLSKINLSIYIDNGYLRFARSIEDGWYHTKRVDFLTDVPTIEYHFKYSVSKKSLSRFDKILSVLLSNGTLVNEKFSIKIDHYSKFLEEKEIKIKNVDFVQRHYKLKLPVTEIIILVNSVEEVVKVISEFYEYDEDGTEICKLKYPISSIVSTKDDKTGNYMIMGYYFDINEFEIVPIYIISKIETELNSEVLIFGDEKHIFEENIIPNREDRINTLLN